MDQNRNPLELYFSQLDTEVFKRALEIEKQQCAPWQAACITALQCMVPLDEIAKQTLEHEVNFTSYFVVHVCGNPSSDYLNRVLEKSFRGFAAYWIFTTPDVEVVRNWYPEALFGDNILVDFAIEEDNSLRDFGKNKESFPFSENQDEVFHKTFVLVRVERTFRKLP